ncbi:methyl-accepting chemotaxis protein [Endothiovibrio diazotrophicus]
MGAHPEISTHDDLLRLDPEAIERAKRFVDFTAKDAELLAGLRPVVEPHAAAIVDAFYGRIVQFPHLTRLIGEAGSNVERLKRTQVDYLVQLFSGDYGLDYFIRRRKIGLIHNRVGLGPGWYLGGYSLYRQLVMPLLVEHFAKKPKKMLRAIAALDKLLALDAEQAITSYIDSVMLDLGALSVSKEEIERQVTDYGRVIEAVAAGDLSQRVAAEGEDDMSRLGRSLNDMIGSLAVMTGGIAGAVEAILASVDAVKNAVADQSSGAAEQAAAVNETTSTLSEIRATSNQTAEKASGLGTSAERTREAGERGLRMVEENIAGMQSIRAKVEVIAETILSLSRQTQQIGEITGVVAGLAQHSKMLALNASIEAAKAGDSGRGFAVVAAEVKDLAEQSEESTSQVQKILTEIQHATDRAVMATEEGTKGVDQGVELMGRTGEVVRDLQGVIQQSVLASQQIVAAVRQEAVGVDQVATAMGEINQVTGQFVAATKRTSEANEELSRLAARLGEMVQRFKS